MLCSILCSTGRNPVSPRPNFSWERQLGNCNPYSRAVYLSVRFEKRLYSRVASSLPLFRGLRRHPPLGELVKLVQLCPGVVFRCVFHIDPRDASHASRISPGFFKNRFPSEIHRRSPRHRNMRIFRLALCMSLFPQKISSSCTTRMHLRTGPLIEPLSCELSGLER
jgi:hypothetical protein